LPVAVLLLKVEFETLTEEEEYSKWEIDSEYTPAPLESLPVTVLPLKVEFSTLTEEEEEIKEEEEKEKEHTPPPARIVACCCITTKGWIWNTY